jgi:microsomal dipeptidase-like Zn-dependent dipeptidase
MEHNNIDDLSSIEDSTEINELIEELSRLGTKDRKLKELAAEYSVESISATFRIRDKHYIQLVIL